jgi:hypothetical protein
LHGSQGWQQLHVAVADVLVPAAQANVLDCWDCLLRVVPLEAEVAACWACANGDAALAVVDPDAGEAAGVHRASCKPSCLQFEVQERWKLSELQAAAAGTLVQQQNGSGTGCSFVKGVLSQVSHTCLKGNGSSPAPSALLVYCVPRSRASSSKFDQCLPTPFHPHSSLF